MVTTDEKDIASLPLVPANPLPFKQRLAEVRKTHTCQVTFRESGGQVTRVTLGPRWFAPPIVWVMSPAGARDVLGRKDDACDRTAVHREMRLLMGDNLADLPNAPWLSRKRTLQPLFTKQYVRRFGDHMAEAAAMIADGWRDGTEVNLDADSRRLTMRALGRSVLGTDLDERSYAVAEPLNIALSHVADRGTRPVNPPRWLPLPSRRRAVAAYTTMHRLAEDILQACRADPTLDAPLVHALIGATDPETGRRLSDDDICNDMIAFIVAGHDTTATTIAYALWALGRHPDVQDRVAAEAAALGERPLGPTMWRACLTPCRWCTRCCGCARRCRWRGERPCGTSRSTVAASRRAAWCWSASSACTVTRRCGTTRWRSIRTGSAPRISPGSTAGSTSRSGPARGRASVTTSRCSS